MVEIISVHDDRVCLCRFRQQKAQHDKTNSSMKDSTKVKGLSKVRVDQ